MLRLHSCSANWNRDKEKGGLSKNEISDDPNIGAKPAKSGGFSALVFLHRPLLESGPGKMCARAGSIARSAVPCCFPSAPAPSRQGSRAMPANFHSVWVGDLMKPTESYQPSSILSPGPLTSGSTVEIGQNCASKTNVQR